MFGRIARANAFEGVFRSGEILTLLALGAQKIRRICCTPLPWDDSILALVWWGHDRCCVRGRTHDVVWRGRRQHDPNPFGAACYVLMVAMHAPQQGAVLRTTVARTGACHDIDVHTTFFS